LGSVRREQFEISLPKGRYALISRPNGTTPLLDVLRFDVDGPAANMLKVYVPAWQTDASPLRLRRRHCARCNAAGTDIYGAEPISKDSSAFDAGPTRKVVALRRWKCEISGICRRRGANFKHSSACCPRVPLRVSLRRNLSGDGIGCPRVE